MAVRIWALVKPYRSPCSAALISTRARLIRSFLSVSYATLICFAVALPSQSPNGLYVLQFLSDGNLGLFAGGVELWSAPRTANRGIPGKVAFDPQTGIVTMYSTAGQEWWASNELWFPKGSQYADSLDQHGCSCGPSDCWSARGWLYCARYYGGAIPWCASTTMSTTTTYPPQSTCVFQSMQGFVFSIIVSFFCCHYLFDQVRLGHEHALNTDRPSTWMVHDTNHPSTVPQHDVSPRLRRF